MSEKSNFFRVFVDTNVLISAMTSKASVSRKLLLLLSEEHQLIICSYSIEEVSRVLSKRFPDKLAEWDQLLMRLEFELTYTIGNFCIRRATYTGPERFADPGFSNGSPARYHCYRGS